MPYALCISRHCGTYMDTAGLRRALRILTCLMSAAWAQQLKLGQADEYTNEKRG